MQFSEQQPAPRASRSVAAVSSVAARGETQRYYQEVFRVRELESLDASQEALKQGTDEPDLSHHHTASSLPAIHEDEATRAQQLTGLQANDPFLASANARFQARLEARHGGTGARALQQHDARDALAAALRQVEAAKAVHREAVQAQEVFYIKTGGEVLSAEEILRERITAHRLDCNVDEALVRVKLAEREQAQLQAKFERAGYTGAGETDTLVCTPATAHGAPSGLRLDVTLPQYDDDGGSGSGLNASHGSSRFKQHRATRSPPTRQRRRTKDPEMPRSEDNLTLRRNVRMSSMPEGALSPVLRRTAVRHARPASLPSLAGTTAPLGDTRTAEIEESTATEATGKESRREWSGNQTVAGQLLALSREAYRNQRRPSYANDGKPRSLSAEPPQYDSTLSRSGNFGAYMSLEKSVTGAWRGRGNEASGGFGNLAIGGKLENNLETAWRSLAARRVASQKAAEAVSNRKQQRWSSPYRAVRQDRAIKMGAAGGAIEKLLNI